MKIICSITGMTAVLLLASCIFDTRDANPPGGGGGGGGCVLDDPQKPFGCMANALAALQDGDYERSISNNFVFTPTPADALDELFEGTCVFDDWNKETEKAHVEFLVSDSSKLTWQRTLVSKINENTFVQFEATYSLLVVDKAAEPDTTTYRGVALIDVRNEGGQWRVTSWNETQNIPGSATWGWLRGFTRLQTEGAACPP